MAYVFIRPPPFPSESGIRAGKTNQISIRNRDDWILKGNKDELF